MMVVIWKVSEWNEESLHDFSWRGIKVHAMLGSFFAINIAQQPKQRPSLLSTGHSKRSSPRNSKTGRDSEKINETQK